MKKTKRILALIGAILLLLLYVVAFVATVLDHTSDMRYWKAAVAATIIIPVLIWAYSFVYRLLKGSDKESDDVTKKPMKRKITPELSSKDWKEFCSRFHFDNDKLPLIRAIYTQCFMVMPCIYSINRICPGYPWHTMPTAS